jgi:hypothetical protein
MGKALTPEAIAAFRDDGYYFPIQIFDRAEADSLYPSYTQFQKSAVEILGQEQRFKTHLLSTWFNGIVRNPRILDIVEDLIGPNILLWSTSFFPKPAHSDGYVGLHQDAALSDLEPHDDMIHVWLALLPSTKENGCMRVVPRLHLHELIPQSPSVGEGNLLLAGKEANVDIEESEFVDVLLDAGEVSLHQHLVLHDSGPNRSDGLRLGVVMNFMRPTMRNAKVPDSAMLVRGNDECGNFELEPAPDADFSCAAIATFQRALTTQGGGVGYG